MDNTSKKEILSGLKEKCSRCRACALCETRTNVVFGKGNENAPVMFVGEAPGEKEDLSGEPFVGAAGKLLDKYLTYIGLGLGDVYIANVLKCRPPHNRDPLPEEEDACIGFLLGQIEAVKPKVIVCLGRISAMRLIGGDFRITRDHGKWFEFHGVPISAVYHPAALLRDPRKKQEMIIDFEMLEQKLKNLTD
ncbi:MAG: uracil-DNA glycosylase [Clostridia bacterium]|nr:uracil-DNA glycosylase [Clostridia bacterium]